MTRNIGTADRIIRILLGAGLILAAAFSQWALFATTLPQVVAIIAGIVLIATAFARFCPLYTLLGMRTCRR